MKANTTHARRFFSEIHGRMGPRQIMTLLDGTPYWWNLRDSQGYTPLMSMLRARGMTPQLFSQLVADKRVARTLGACDNAGRNIYWHLIRQRNYKDAAEFVESIRGHATLGPSSMTGRGIMIDQVLFTPSRKWSYFFPAKGLEAKLYGMKEGKLHQTWWQSSQEDAHLAGAWLLGTCDHRPIADPFPGHLMHLHNHDLGWIERIDERLAGALLLCQAMGKKMYSSNQWLWETLERKPLPPLTAKQREKLDARIKALDPARRPKVEALMAAHDHEQLMRLTPEASLIRPVRRL